MLNWHDYAQAFIAVFVITDPVGESVFFMLLTKDEPRKRPRSAVMVAITVAVILGGATLVGRELLDLMGIHLGAFGVAGGLIVAAMGFEMLAGGNPSRV